MHRKLIATILAILTCAVITSTAKAAINYTPTGNLKLQSGIVTELIARINVTSATDAEKADLIGWITAPKAVEAEVATN